MQNGLRPPHLLGAALLCAVVACDGAPGDRAASATTTAATTASATATATVDADVLVTVNGVPIRVPDLHYVLAKKAKRARGGASEAEAEAALNTMIEQELVRQRAEALGLDQDPDYKRKLHFMQAPVNDLARTELGELFFAKQVADKAKVSDADARKHFEQNAAKYKTEVRLFQILVRGDEAKIVALKKELDGGADFETVAAKLQPTELPEGAKPWDLGYLRWDQVPPHFAEVIAQMKEGEISDILHGPKQRAWILKLVERRANESITFEQVRPQIVKELEGAKMVELSKKIAAELRTKANVVVVRKPGAMPPPPDPED